MEKTQIPDQVNGSAPRFKFPVVDARDGKTYETRDLSDEQLAHLITQVRVEFQGAMQQMNQALNLLTNLSGIMHTLAFESDRRANKLLLPGEKR